MRSERQITDAATARRKKSVELSAQSRELLAESNALLKRSDAAGALVSDKNMVRFLQADLKVGLTFATIALQTTNDAKRQRNRKKARSAYDTVRRHLERVRLSDTDKAEFQSRVAELKAALQQLGESL